MIDAVVVLLVSQAAEYARGTLLGDSSGFSIVRYEDWEHAKRGIVSGREFNKLHILTAPHGMIVTCRVPQAARTTRPHSGRCTGADRRATTASS